MHTNTIGTNELRVDARDKVTGNALYPADIYMGGMVYGYTVRASKPSAYIEVDKAAALEHPGVLAVYTAGDVPGKNHHGVILKDHEVLVSQKVKSLGEPVAYVVAETSKAAEEAARLVKVKYTELPGVFDPREAMKDGAPKVHDCENEFYHFKLRKGDSDIEKAFAECDVIVENYYQSSMVDHAFLQPEAGVAYVDTDGTVVVIVATQYPHFAREEIAAVLGIEEAKVRVVTAAVGGAFGGREDMTLQVHVALAAYKLGRPVKSVYSREESFLSHSKRHPMYMKYRTGAKKDGKLHALQAEIIGDSGAHASWAFSILRKSGVHATGPYMIPNVMVDTYAVYTNNPFTGAMRGFGAAQVTMAYEQQIDEIARRLGINPVEMRLKNCFTVGSETATGQILEESVPLRETLIKAAKAMGYSFDEEVRP